MANKHVNAAQIAISQKAQQAAARKAAQQQQGSNKFKGGSNTHGDGQGQSGQSKR